MYLIYLLLLILISMVIIWRASNGFEAASSYLGRNFSDGVRGATINAIGSSLPELLTVIIGLLLFIDKDGFAMGVGTTAGSAIFNSAVIPAAVIITVTIGLAKQVKVSKKVILRDGLWLIACEVVLIFLLSKGEMEWWHGLILILLYVGYIVFMFKTMSGSEWNAHTKEEEEEEAGGNRAVALLTLDLQWFMFAKRSLNRGTAWLLLMIAIIVISLACWLLVEAVYGLAKDVLGISVYFVAVILAAAATSVPDTILSIKDAKAGQYDDAVANALGSNIFDITICLGLPLMLFGLIYGSTITMLPESQAPVTELRSLLLIFTIIAFAIYYFGAAMGKIKAFLLLGLYLAFVGYIIASASEVPIFT
jgi:cation:H+ antiporter